MELNLLGFMELLLFLQFNTFVCEEREICRVAFELETIKCAAFSPLMRGETILPVASKRHENIRGRIKTRLVIYMY